MISEARFESGENLGAPAEISESPWVVMKFGGSSVSSAENWNTIAGLVRNRLDEGLKPVVVHSALKDVSNTLHDSLEKAVSGDPSDGLNRIRQQH